MTEEIKNKEYWDRVYSTELDNYIGHEEDPEDWFALAKGLQAWIVGECKEEITGDWKVLDVGAGAGNFLFELAKLMPRAKFVGVDYSLQAVQLAKEIANDREFIEFYRADATCGLDEAVGNRKFNLVNDKGTLDVIILNGNDKVDAYFQQLVKVVEKNGFLCITSCNHTQQELHNLCKSKGFELVSNRTYPVFQFGGNSGSQIATVLFKFVN
jgi:SAM-dependent methyltransferase